MGLQLRTKRGKLMKLHHPHGGCPILAFFFARVGGDAAGATLVRSSLPVVYASSPPFAKYANDGGGVPIFAPSHGGCPILAFFARACPELAEGVGGVLPAQLLSVLHYPLWMP